jgi:hypothetical protein
MDKPSEFILINQYRSLSFVRIEHRRLFHALVSNASPRTTYLKRFSRTLLGIGHKKNHPAVGACRSHEIVPEACGGA